MQEHVNYQIVLNGFGTRMSSTSIYRNTAFLQQANVVGIHSHSLNIYIMFETKAKRERNTLKPKLRLELRLKLVFKRKTEKIFRTLLLIHQTMLQIYSMLSAQHVPLFMVCACACACVFSAYACVRGMYQHGKQIFIAIMLFN